MRRTSGTSTERTYSNKLPLAGTAGYLHNQCGIIGVVFTTWVRIRLHQMKFAEITSLSAFRVVWPGVTEHPLTHSIRVWTPCSSRRSSPQPRQSWVWEAP
jgi:hypothetical protein